MAKTDIAWMTVMMMILSLIKQSKVNWVSWSDQEDDDTSVLKKLLDRVFNEMEDQYNAKVNSYTEARKTQEAEKKAKEDLLPKYNKSFRTKYAKWWEVVYDLEKNNTQHHQENHCDLMDEADMEWQEAIQMALKKITFLLQKLFQGYEPEEEEEDEED